VFTNRPVQALVRHQPADQLKLLKDWIVSVPSFRDRRRLAVREIHEIDMVWKNQIIA
jgi:hypothetical protein